MNTEAADLGAQLIGHAEYSFAHLNTSSKHKNRKLEGRLYRRQQAMGRFFVQHAVLCVHARASRAMIREADGFRLRDAMRASNSNLYSPDGCGNEGRQAAPLSKNKRACVRCVVY